MRPDTRLGEATDLITLDTAGLGNRSYVIAADGWAVAVDVPRDIDRVEHVLAERGLRLAGVVETHIHNDYVTGGLALARRMGVRYYVPAGPELRFEAERVSEGDSFEVGPGLIRVINAPGHTDAHVVYSMHEGNAPAVAAFTGGSLLEGGTGRTDLLGPDRTEALARAQYWSIRRLARLLPGTARVLPTHGFGSFCRAGTAAPKAVGVTVAEQLQVSPVFNSDEESFVRSVTEDLGPIPKYFPLMAPRNLAGPDGADVSLPPVWGSGAVQEWVRQGGRVIDVRPRAEFARGHFRGSISTDADGAMATWAGWTTPIDDPVVVVAPNDRQLVHARRELARIGFDAIVAGYFGAPAADARESIPRSTFREAGNWYRRRREIAFLDVRDLSEWRQGHIAGAIHVPTYDLEDHVHSGGILPDNPWVHCRGGYRAAVASSVLARLGVPSVMVDDNIAAARRNRLPWCDATDCADDRCATQEAPAHQSHLVRSGNR